MTTTPALRNHVDQSQSWWEPLDVVKFLLELLQQIDAFETAARKWPSTASAPVMVYIQPLTSYPLPALAL